MNTVEIQAAEAMLDTRLRIHLPAPWFLRLLRIKSIPYSYYRPVYAQLLRMSRLYVKMGIDLEKMEEAETIERFTILAKNGIVASRIIACGMIRSTWRTFFFHRLLARYMRRRMDANTMAELTKLIISFAGAENFFNIIRSIAHVKVTTPNLSQEKTES
jgi:hypothetical protein